MEALKRRIKHYSVIENNGFESLENLPHRIETRRPGSDIVSVGETVDYVFVIEKGWAIRYRMLDDGRRQILNFMLPGDCFDLMSLTQAKSDHAIAAATEVRLRRLSFTDFRWRVKRLFVSSYPSNFDSRCSWLICCAYLPDNVET